MRGGIRHYSPAKNNDLRRLVTNAGPICNLIGNLALLLNRYRVNRHRRVTYAESLNLLAGGPTHRTSLAVLEQNGDLIGLDRVDVERRRCLCWIVIRFR